MLKKLSRVGYRPIFLVIQLHMFSWIPSSHYPDTNDNNLVTTLIRTNARMHYLKSYLFSYSLYMGHFAPTPPHPTPSPRANTTSSSYSWLLLSCRITYVRFFLRILRYQRFSMIRRKRQTTGETAKQTRNKPLKWWMSILLAVLKLGFARHLVPNHLFTNRRKCS